MAILLRIMVILACVLAYGTVGIACMALTYRIAHEDFRRDAQHGNLVFSYIAGWPLIMVVVLLLIPAIGIFKAMEAREKRRDKK